jgi:hypothetical protein
MRASLLSVAVLLLSLLAGCSSFSERYVAKHPDLDPQTREAILQHRVILGMFPDEAIAATAGHRQPYVFAVKPDPTRWPEGSDPEQVIWYERAHPDNSKIDINFWTRSQFDTTNLVGFKVVFSHGRASSITRLPTKPKTRLSQEEATRIAREAAVKHGYRLADYRKGTANYGFLRDGFWMALFESKAPALTNNFEVWIDDQTGDTQIKPWNEEAQPEGGANGSQPIRSETNSTSLAAGSRRSP